MHQEHLVIEPLPEVVDVSSEQLAGAVSGFRQCMYAAVFALCSGAIAGSVINTSSSRPSEEVDMPDQRSLEELVYLRDLIRERHRDMELMLVFYKTAVSLERQPPVLGEEPLSVGWSSDELEEIIDTYNKNVVGKYLVCLRELGIPEGGMTGGQEFPDASYIQTHELPWNLRMRESE